MERGDEGWRERERVRGEGGRKRWTGGKPEAWWGERGDSEVRGGREKEGGRMRERRKERVRGREREEGRRRREGEVEGEGEKPEAWWRERGGRWGEVEGRGGREGERGGRWRGEERGEEK